MPTIVEISACSETFGNHMMSVTHALGESVDAFYASLGQYALKSQVHGNDALTHLMLERGSS